MLHTPVLALMKQRGDICNSREPFLTRTPGGRCVPTALRSFYLGCPNTAPLPAPPPPGSMRGPREVVAKALALECMRAAKAQERGCYVFAFAGPQEVRPPPGARPAHACARMCMCPPRGGEQPGAKSRPARCPYGPAATLCSPRPQPTSSCLTSTTPSVMLPHHPPLHHHHHHHHHPPPPPPIHTHTHAHTHTLPPARCASWSSTWT